MNPLEAFSAIKMTASALKSAIKLHQQVEIDLKASELLEKIDSLSVTIMELYEKNLELIKEKAELEKKVVNNEQWEKEKTKYKLYELDTEIYVYAYQKSNNNTDPMHYVCKKCMEDGKKSVLDFIHENSDGSKKYHCNRCDVSFSTHAKRKLPINYQPRYDGPNSWMSL